jgi:hypothetical protein
MEAIEATWIISYIDSLARERQYAPLAKSQARKFHHPAKSAADFPISWTWSDGSPGIDSSTARHRAHKLGQGRSNKPVEDRDSYKLIHDPRRATIAAEVIS